MSLTPNAPDAPVVNAAVLREIIKVQPFTRWTGLEILKAEAGWRGCDAAGAPQGRHDPAPWLSAWRAGRVPGG